jgi:drug/metabolite transporter (DMT)-like permease
MSRRAWLSFAAVSLLWGMPYLFIKIAVLEVSPAFVAWARITGAGLILLPVAWRLGAFRGMRRRVGALIAFAGLEVAVPFSLIPLGETMVSSSLTAILIAALPLAVALLALRFAPDERLTLLRALGLVVGLAGVITLLGVEFTGRPGELVGASCIILATLCYASASIVVNRGLGTIEPLGSVAVALGLSSIALTPFAVLAHPVSVPSVQALLALAGLSVLCTAVALVLYISLITEAGPSRASFITYLNPAVAVVLGVIVLGESLTALTIAELLLILFGSWLSTDGRVPPGLAARPRALATTLRRLLAREASR